MHLDKPKTKTWWPCNHQVPPHFSLTFQLCGCYQPPGLSSFDFRLSVPLLSVSRFLIWSRGSLSQVLEGAGFSLYV
nr:hypothetical protein CFP56_06644 [Quercus suber]